MITARIKSPNGNRDEEWEDAQVSKDQMSLVEEFTAFVIGFPDENGQEKLTLVPKYYWDMYDEISNFVIGVPGEYPQITEFTKVQLQEIGSYFQEYLAIEKLFMAQETVPAERYDELKQQKDAIEMRNDAAYEHLLSIALAFSNNDTAVAPAQIAIRPMVMTLYDFTIFFGDSLKGLESVLSGLRDRAAGGGYTPLDFVRDLAEFKRLAEARRKQEHDLTAARNVFMGYLKAVEEGTVQFDTVPAVSDDTVATTDEAAAVEQPSDAGAVPSETESTAEVQSDEQPESAPVEQPEAPRQTPQG